MENFPQLCCMREREEIGQQNAIEAHWNMSFQFNNIFHVARELGSKKAKRRTQMLPITVHVVCFCPFDIKWRLTFATLSTPFSVNEHVVALLNERLFGFERLHESAVVLVFDLRLSVFFSSLFFLFSLCRLVNCESRMTTLYNSHLAFSYIYFILLNLTAQLLRKGSDKSSRGLAWTWMPHMHGKTVIKIICMATNWTCGFDVDMQAMLYDDDVTHPSSSFAS